MKWIIIVVTYIVVCCKLSYCFTILHSSCIHNFFDQIYKQRQFSSCFILDLMNLTHQILPLSFFFFYRLWYVFLYFFGSFLGFLKFLFEFFFFFLFLGFGSFFLLSLNGILHNRVPQRGIFRIPETHT